MSSSKAPVVLPEARIFDGSPQEISNVRAFVRQLLDGYPVADDAILLTSELATNAVRHTASGADGMFFVLVRPSSEFVRVEVHDLGSDTVPALVQSRGTGESGSGLKIVDSVADRWGFHSGPHGLVVWFEMDLS